MIYPQRIVTIGDSITDGHTYQLLLRQALAEAGKPVSIVVNAGVSGDTAKGMRARIERDVLPHRPTLATFHAGANDAVKKVDPADYEADVEAIAQRLAEARVPLMLLTPCPMSSPVRAESIELVSAYEAALRRIAARHTLTIADIHRAMCAARDAGETVLAPDGIHLEFAGYRAFTRAMLDAMGYADVPVPGKMSIEPMPGLITPWQIRRTDENEPTLTPATIQSQHPNESWTRYVLPEPRPHADWWPEQERQYGFAMSLSTLVGEAPRYVGVATIDSSDSRPVYFNPGGMLQTIWLNDRQIYQVDGWTGFHAGRERVGAKLNAGENRVVIETGSRFFLSVTETNDW